MKNVFVTILLAALPAWAVQFTNTNFDGITAGKPFDITWTDASGSVTLTLKNGESDNLQTVGEITSGQTGESYTWTPSTSLASGTYALEINDGTEVNYSKQFEITGGSSSATSSSTTASSTSSTVSITSSTASSSTVSSTTTSSSASSSATTSSSASSSTTSGSSNSSSATSASSTSSASQTSSAASTSASVVPNTNAAQTVAPFVAPMLLAVGAVFM
ncbi:Ser-Thr-rich glycosyl-phosphatidyl-inositol-anchored membrane family-domain-containing protein [Annulohypoxylon moriforme]|nr:Ser-Thr-rich glycosyl-phosphatidyl-inositol-anchored membrane family-domain-containing protein [Annulohypoxylon moriforme]